MGTFMLFSAFPIIFGEAGLCEHPGTYAIFMIVGFLVGAAIAYGIAASPNFDYTEVKIDVKKLIPAILIWGIIMAGVSMMFAYLYVMYGLYA